MVPHQEGQSAAAGVEQTISRSPSEWQKSRRACCGLVCRQFCSVRFAIGLVALYLLIVIFVQLAKPPEEPPIFGGPGYRIPQQPCAVIAGNGITAVLGEKLLVTTLAQEKPIDKHSVGSGPPTEGKMVVQDMENITKKRCHRGLLASLEVPNPLAVAVLPSGSIAIGSKHGHIHIFGPEVVRRGIGRAASLLNATARTPLVEHLRDEAVVVGTQSGQLNFYDAGVGEMQGAGGMRGVQPERGLWPWQEEGHEDIKELKAQPEFRQPYKQLELGSAIVDLLLVPDSDMALVATYRNGLQVMRTVQAATSTGGPTRWIFVPVRLLRTGDSTTHLTAFSDVLIAAASQIVGSIHIFRLFGDRATGADWRVVRSMQFDSYSLRGIAGLKGEILAAGLSGLPYPRVEVSQGTQSYNLCLPLRTSGTVERMLALPSGDLAVGTSEAFVDIFTNEGLCLGGWPRQTIPTNGQPRDMALLPGGGIVVVTYTGEVDLFNVSGLDLTRHRDDKDEKGEQKMPDVPVTSWVPTLDRGILQVLGMHWEPSVVMELPVNSSFLPADMLGLALLFPDVEAPHEDPWSSLHIHTAAGLLSGELQTPLIRQQIAMPWARITLPGRLSIALLYSSDIMLVGGKPCAEQRCHATGAAGVLHVVRGGHGGLQLVRTLLVGGTANDMVHLPQKKGFALALDNCNILLYEESHDEAHFREYGRLHSGSGNLCPNLAMRQLVDGTLVAAYGERLELFSKATVHRGSGASRGVLRTRAGAVHDLLPLPDGGLAVGTYTKAVLLYNSSTLNFARGRPFGAIYPFGTSLGRMRLLPMGGLLIGSRVYFPDGVHEQCAAGYYSLGGYADCMICPPWWMSKPGSASCQYFVLSRGVTIVIFFIMIFGFCCCLAWVVGQFCARSPGVFLLQAAFLLALAGGICSLKIEERGWLAKYGKIGPIARCPLALFAAAVVLLITTGRLVRETQRDAAAVAATAPMCAALMSVCSVAACSVLNGVRAGAPIVSTPLGRAAANTTMSTVAAIALLLSSSFGLVGLAFAYEGVAGDHDSVAHARSGLEKSESWAPGGCCSRFLKRIHRLRPTYRQMHLLALMNAMMVIYSFTRQVEVSPAISLRQDKVFAVMILAVLAVLIHLSSLLVDWQPSWVFLYSDRQFRASTLVKACLVTLKCQLIVSEGIFVEKVTIAEDGDIMMPWSCVGDYVDSATCPKWCVASPKRLHGRCVRAGPTSCECHYDYKMSASTRVLLLINVLGTNLVLVALSWVGTLRARTRESLQERSAGGCRALGCMLILLMVPKVLITSTMVILCLENLLVHSTCYDEYAVAGVTVPAAVLLAMGNECKKFLKWRPEHCSFTAVESGAGVHALQHYAAVVAFVGGSWCFMSLLQGESRCPLLSAIQGSLLIVSACAATILPPLDHVVDVDDEDYLGEAAACYGCEGQPPHWQQAHSGGVSPAAASPHDSGGLASIREGNGSQPIVHSGSSTGSSTNVELSRMPIHPWKTGSKARMDTLSLQFGTTPPSVQSSPLMGLSATRLSGLMDLEKTDRRSHPPRLPPKPSAWDVFF